MAISKSDPDLPDVARLWNHKIPADRQVDLT
jgi:hypothetical protein